MSVRIAKFGGSSLADANQFRKVADIIKSCDERKYVVPSAPGKRFSDDIKVTDMLYKCYADVTDGVSFDTAFAGIKERFDGIIADLSLDLSLESEYAKIAECFTHNCGRDYAASRGEYLNGIILAAFLGFPFVDAADVIFFDDKGTFDAQRSYDAVAQMAKKNSCAVIPGFYGLGANEKIKTFSRGGSDVTGSIVARGVGADLYENWTDVSGFLVADPRIVDNPEVIDVVTFRELRELSYMGATVLHEDAIFPVRTAGIPINIKNTNRPEDPGTMILPVRSSGVKTGSITGIAGKRGFSVITMEKDMMNQEIGFAKRALTAFENHNISFEHLPSGIDTMGIVVNSDSIQNIEKQLVADIKKLVAPDTIEVIHGLALIAVVGRGMVRSKGLAARLFTAIANAGINIRMIDQGSSELNIIIAVDEYDFSAAINAIYNEFFR